MSDENLTTGGNACVTDHLPDAAGTWEITPEKVAEWIHLPRDRRPRLIDCREQDELAICQIAGHEWFPLGIFPTAGERLTHDDARGVVVYCHHGMRSLRGAAILRAQGVENAFSMQGGIDAWSLRIDPEVARGVVVYCHHGMRSLRGAAILRAQGVENAFSMQGGIDAWSLRIDPEVARY